MWRRAPLVVAVLVASGALLAPGALAGGAIAQPQSANDGAQRFDDLGQLNSRLAHEIARLETAKLGDFAPAQVGRALTDLAATKPSVPFPPVLGMPYANTFGPLSCVGEQLTVATEVLGLVRTGHIAVRLSARRSAGELLQAYLMNADALLHAYIKNAKSCNDRLDAELGARSAASPGLTDLLRELRSKLARGITMLDTANLGGLDPTQVGRSLNDLEVTELGAVEQLPEVLDLSYASTFGPLSCVDEQIAVATEILRLFRAGQLAAPFSSRTFVHELLQGYLENAQACNDELEVELLRSFDLQPSEQLAVGVGATARPGTDTQNPNQLNATGKLERAYKDDGFVGRHERDYVATGINSNNPDTWPHGRNVLFLDVFDLFGSTSGAQKATTTSEQILKLSGFTPIPISSLGPGEAAFQHHASASLLSTIILVHRGRFIMQIAGACNGCALGSVESSLQSEAQAQLTRAVLMGFPGPAPSSSGSPGTGTGGSGGGGGGSVSSYYFSGSHQSFATFNNPQGGCPGSSGFYDSIAFATPSPGTLTATEITPNGGTGETLSGPVQNDGSFTASNSSGMTLTGTIDLAAESAAGSLQNDQNGCFETYDASFELDAFVANISYLDPTQQNVKVTAADNEPSGTASVNEVDIDLLSGAQPLSGVVEGGGSCSISDSTVQCPVSLPPGSSVAIDISLASPLPAGHGGQAYFTRDDNVDAGPFNASGP